MGIWVCGGASLMCSMGAAPGTLNVLPANKTLTNMPFANIMDNKPFVNVTPFGVCRSPANPQVAAMTPVPPPGVIKPQPCIPNLASPWAPGSPTVLIGNMPALNESSKLMCNWGGVISISAPGQVKTMVP